MRKKELSISSIHRVSKEDEQRTLFLLISFPKRKLMNVESGEEQRRRERRGTDI